MTIEEHLKQICGQKDFEIATLRGALDVITDKLAKYEPKKEEINVPQPPKGNGQDIHVDQP